MHPRVQALLGGALALSLLLIGRRLTPFPRSWLSVVGASILLLALLPLVPLPVGIAKAIAPERAALAQAVALDGQAPQLLPLTLSTTASVQRLWQLSLVVLCFFIARQAGRDGRLGAVLAKTLLSAIGLLVLSELVRRFAGGLPFTATWPGNGPVQGGPFVNRNHFANWLVVASLFAFGCALSTKAAGALRVALFALPVAGAFTAVATGSRAGLAALCAGLVVLALLVRKPARPALGLLFICAIALLAASSALALERFARAPHDAGFKLQIWAESLRIFAGHWAFGTGPGTFERAFDYYKRFGADLSFVHAENEWIQLLVEHGVFVAAGALILLAVALQKLMQAARTPGNNGLLAGGVAALAAFLVHCSFEFVFQITANGMLAASVCGWLIGRAQNSAEPVAPAPPGPLCVMAVSLLALGLISAAALQWTAWRAIDLADLRQTHPFIKALRLWPWNSDAARALASAERDRLLRRAASIPSADPAALQAVRRALQRDPLNWRLRLEALTLRDAAGEPLATLVAEARQILKTNPMQPGLPLMFARRFAEEEPEFALECAQRAARSERALPEALRLAWTLERDPALLWAMTPLTDAGMQALGNFAAAQGLHPMAARAYAQISENVPALIRAENFLKARDPERAVALLRGRTAEEHFIRARAFQLLGRDAQAIAEAEKVWMGRAFAFQSSAPELLDAEKELSKPPPERDLDKLRKLAQVHRGEPRLLWILFTTERDLDFHEAAASRGIELARQVLTGK